MRCFLLSVGLVGSAICWAGLAPKVAWAQVTPDGTLGTTVSTVGNNATITNGTAAGGNLFHSFQQFSIPTGGSATFDLVNTPNISTLFSRVTGGSVSNIDGMIQTINGNNPVSLFLLNPNGILFGPNASLDISGSFVGTTANSIKFADGTEFSATSPTATPLLTVSVPIGLQMGQNPGAINVQGSGGQNFILIPFTPVIPTGISRLQVNGKTLALIGGSVDLRNATLSAPGGRVEVGGVGANGLVNIVPIVQGYRFDYGNALTLGDVGIFERSFITASGFIPGSIQVQGRNITIKDGSLLEITNQGLPIPSTIDIIAQQSATLIDSTIFSETLGGGNSSDIRVLAPNLTLLDGGLITSRSFSPVASSGKLTIQTDFLTLSGFSPINIQQASEISTASIYGQRAGDIAVSTHQLQLLEGGGIISTSLFGQGDAGDVTVNADHILVSGVVPNLAPSIIGSLTFTAGNAGSVLVNTQTLALRSSGSVSATSLSDGSAGSVTINASQSVEISGKSPDLQYPSNISSSVAPAEPLTRQRFGLPDFPKGDAKDVTINTPRLVISDQGDGFRANVSVATIGSGQGGQLVINANSVILNGGFLAATTLADEGGNIVVNADFLQMRNAGKIGATAGGSGNGGNITINAPVIAGFENSDIVANAFQGRGGNIQITTEGIFGLKFRSQLTPENDITASSRFGINGTVQVNTLGIDPSAGLVELPVNLTDPSRQIATGCVDNQDNQFVITGRGGIPENPTQPLRSDRAWADTRDLSEFLPRASQPAVAPTALTPPPIVEASTLSRINGQLELVAVNSPAPRPRPATCARAIDPAP